MAINIIVCMKQVMDPETPASAFNIDSDAKKVVPAQGIPPVVNGFDENAVEASLSVDVIRGTARNLDDHERRSRAARRMARTSS